MKENYYDILQVNKNASPEIIEKAYKTLVKMYHPDLQEGTMRQEYEEKLKEINEAFEVLSNEEKRRQYDLAIKQEEIKNKQSMYNNQNIQENPQYNNQDISGNNNINNNTETTKDIYEEDKTEDVTRYTSKIANQISHAVNNAYNKAYNDAYNDAYIQSLRDRGYRIRYKKTLKDHIKDFITLIAVIIILVVLWHIPFIKNYFIKLYNENDVLQFIINLFINSIKTIFSFFNIN